jgi:hypothetical protein
MVFDASKLIEQSTAPRQPQIYKKKALQIGVLTPVIDGPQDEQGKNKKRGE